MIKFYVHFVDTIVTLIKDFFSAENTITNTGRNTGFKKFTEELISCSSQNNKFTVKILIQCNVVYENLIPDIPS